MKFDGNGKNKGKGIIDIVLLPQKSVSHFIMISDYY